MVPTTAPATSVSTTATPGGVLFLDAGCHVFPRPSNSQQGASVNTHPLSRRPKASDFISSTQTDHYPFLFHDLSWGTPAAVNQTRSQWEDVRDGLARTIIRSKELLKLRTSFTDEDFKSFQPYAKTTIQDAAFAKKMGIVHDIKEASIPAGNIVASIDV